MAIKEIIKRDGRRVGFEKEKITDAIYKAVKVCGGSNRKRTEELTDIICEEAEKQFGMGSIPTVEQIQNIVEDTLIEQGHAQVAKAYIVYRHDHEKLREAKKRKVILDTVDIINDYIHKKDWMVNGNANMGYSLQGLNNYVTEKQSTNFWLYGIYPESIRTAHQNADIHLHDLGVIGSYCVGWDLEDLLTVGFRGVPGKVASKPAKHLRTALGQMVNFVYTLQGETAGAQAFSNFDTFLAPFIKKDNLNYEEVKQSMQEFLFNINVPTRVGFQAPFTNITMDLKVPDHIKDKPVMLGGKFWEETNPETGEAKTATYGEFQHEMDMINRAFAECMLEGDADGRILPFPIPTYNITKDFDWDDPNLEPIWEMTAKYGVPYFSNFINSDMKPEDARSMCCRLRLDNTQLRKRGGGLFGANPLTGSIGVVTINLPRIGFTSKNENAFFSRLEEMMNISKKSLEMKRETLEELTDLGLYPYAKFYLRNVKQRFNEYWKNHFSTIGILGMNEAITNLMQGENITTEKGREFTLKVMDFMREKLLEYQEETGNYFNLEATPGESTTRRFAGIDKERFGTIITANEEAVKNGAGPFYTNSTQLPVGYTDDIFEALQLQDELQTKYTGGTVLHGFFGERITGDGAKTLVKKIAENFRLPYFTITPTFSICPGHGYLNGEQETCPKCESEGKTTKPEIYSRVVGYIRPVSEWNDGKQAEWKERKTFQVTSQ